jgi:hypothetical protein
MRVIYQMQIYNSHQLIVLVLVEFVELVEFDRLLGLTNETKSANQFHYFLRNICDQTLHE